MKHRHIYNLFGKSYDELWRIYKETGRKVYKNLALSERRNMRAVRRLG